MKKKTEAKIVKETRDTNQLLMPLQPATARPMRLTLDQKVLGSNPSPAVIDSYLQPLT